MRTGATCAAENGHFLRGIENLCKPRDFIFGRADFCLVLLERHEWSARSSFLQCSGSRENNDCDSPERNCSSDCNLEYAWELIRMRNQLTVLTAFSEQKFRVSLLKVGAPNFPYGNMCCNRQDWYPVAIAIVQSVNEMCVSWAAAP